MEFKKCTKCKIDKSVSKFTKCKANKDGLSYYCKECKDKLIKRYDVSVIEKQCKCCNITKPSDRFSKHSYNKDGLKNECKQCVKEYNKTNKDYINQRNLQYFYNIGVHKQRVNRKKRRKNDPLFKLIGTIRSRTVGAFKASGFKKNTKTEIMLGCNWFTCKLHLESLFTEGMSWDNHGEWHIDHIIPLSSAKTAEAMIKLAHYTNLQPLWAKDNLSKGSKLNYVIQLK